MQNEINRVHRNQEELTLRQLEDRILEKSDKLNNLVPKSRAREQNSIKGVYERKWNRLRKQIQKQNRNRMRKDISEHEEKRIADMFQNITQSLKNDLRTDMNYHKNRETQLQNEILQLNKEREMIIGRAKEIMYAQKAKIKEQTYITDGKTRAKMDLLKDENEHLMKQIHEMQRVNAENNDKVDRETKNMARKMIANERKKREYRERLDEAIQQNRELTVYMAKRKKNSAKRWKRDKFNRLESLPDPVIPDEPIVPIRKSQAK